MAVSLIYLMDEICAGAEIYFTGRTGGQYHKTAFILCDDYVELASKLFLIHDNSHWSDQQGGGFKNFHAVLGDVQTVFTNKRAADLPAFQALQTRLEDRRTRRNGFFHSAKLLDLNLSNRQCVEAFCDLFEYGDLLFQQEWRTALSATRNLETFALLFRLEQRSFSDPNLWAKVQAIIRQWPRNIAHATRSGCHLTIHPEDLHLRLTITHGHHALRDKLATL